MQLEPCHTKVMTTMTDTARIRDALTRANETVILRPQRGQRTYRNVATLTEGTLCHVEDGKHNLIIDVGKALGGDDAGPTPVAVLRSAMTSCVAIGIKQWAARRNVDITHLEVVLETDIDARGQLGLRDDIAPGFEAIRLSIMVSSTAPQTLIQDIVEASLSYSPLIDVFANAKAISLHQSVVSTSAD